MLATGSRLPASAGFTLLEFMVVLAIIGLALAIVPPNLMKGTGSQALKADVRMLISGLQYARTRAISSNRPVALAVDPQTMQITVDAQRKIGSLSRTTKLAALGDPTAFETGGGTAVQFFPDGGSSGAELVLSYHQTRYRVSVNWLTGAVSTARE